MVLSDLWSKEVVGAAIGALGGFIAAMWVAKDARMREDRAAAMIVVGTLGNLRAAAHTIELHLLDSASTEEAAERVAERLVVFFPGLDSLYRAGAARVAPLHVVLAVKLHVLNMVHEAMSVSVDRLCADTQQAHQNGAAARPLDAIRHDQQLLAKGLKAIDEHGAVSQELLNRLVLSRWPTFQRIGVRLGFAGSPALRSNLKSTIESLRTPWPPQSSDETPS